MKTVDLHRQATAEMIEAARVYEQRREGLGFRFIRMVEEICDKIGEFPEAGAPLGRKERKRRVPRFPYDVVYRIMEERILVLAIKHHRRRPTTPACWTNYIPTRYPNGIDEEVAPVAYYDLKDAERCDRVGEVLRRTPLPVEPIVVRPDTLKRRCDAGHPVFVRALREGLRLV